ncbi:hypothetical protein B7463_g11975, partial [Scytalidium lignicola]
MFPGVTKQESMVYAGNVKPINIRPAGISKVTGAHVQILREFGERLRWGDDSINISELSFGLDLAGPDTTGGILVLLQQPWKYQTYENGFTADVDNCPTLEAIRQLVSVASNQLSGLDNMSVFDMLPFLTEEYEDTEIFRAAHETLVRMVKDKAPDVVICCAQGSSHLQFVRDIQSLGPGKRFPIQKLEDGTPSFLRVNAFHPSYAVNYNSSYSCFRRLLILEFVKCFSLQQSQWSEEKWMTALRSDCQKKSAELFELNKRRQLSDEPPDPSARWREILDALNLLLRENEFFRLDSSHTIPDIREQLSSTNFSWLCCDAGLFLDEPIRKDAFDSEIAHQTHNTFQDWCLGMWPCLKINDKYVLT